VSSPTTALQFTSFDSNAYTADNDIGAPFVLNSLALNNNSYSSYTVGSFAGKGLEFSGANPTITLSGSGNLTLGFLASGMGTGLTLDTMTTITGSGTNLLGLSTTIAGSGGLVINTASPMAVVSVSSSTNTFSGGVILKSGTFELNGAYSAGTGSLTINGGRVECLATVATATPVIANADLVVAGGSGWTSNGVISGSGGVHVLNQAFSSSKGITLGAANTYQGPTTIDSGPADEGSSSIGTLTIAATGSIASAQGITLGNDSVLALSGNSNNTRIPDSAPLVMNNATFTLAGAQGAGTLLSETVGNLTASGVASFRLAASGAATSVLNVGTFTAVNNATLFIAGAWQGATGATGTLTFSGGLPTVSDPLGPVGGTNTAIVPFASGSAIATAYGPSAAVIYTASGARLIGLTDPSAFVQLGAGGALSAATDDQNVDIALPSSGTVTVTGTHRVNALAWGNGNAGNQYLQGTGTVSVYSGAVFVSGANPLISGPTLDFGTATGYIHLGAPASLGYSCVMTVGGTSSITGSAGVVVSAAGLGSNLDIRLQLDGTVPNAFAGGLTVNGTDCTVAFTNDNQLGSAGGPITLNGGNLDFNAGSGTVVTSRPITVGPAGGAAYTAGTSAGLNLAGTISGPGGLTVGNSAGGQGIVQLSGTNTYSGPTFVNGGILQVDGAANLGSGKLVFNGGILYVTDSTTVPQPSEIWSNANIAVPSGVTLTFPAPITSASATGERFSVADGGTVILAAANPSLSVPINVGTSSGGSANLTLAGSGTIPNTYFVTVYTGSTLAFDNSGTNLTDRYADRGNVILQGGSTLQFIGNASAPSSETLGSLNLSTAGDVSIEVDAGASQPATLTSIGTVFGPGSLVKNGTGTLVLAGTVSSAGGITVNAGTLVLGAAPSATSHVVVADTTLSSSGQVVVPVTNRGVAEQTVLVTPSLALGGPGALDLGNNDMVVQNTSEATVDALVASGELIASGATSLTGLGVIQNDDGTGTGTPLYATFDGVASTTADVLVKFTYLGDTTLKGYVDGTDLANALAGMNGGLTGWENGDFNYDGVVNQIDVDLLLTSLANQGAPLGGPGSGSGAVPEPSVVGLLGCAGVGLIGRRRR
jgi:autotransporter-associated beta strand protein